MQVPFVLTLTKLSDVWRTTFWQTVGLFVLKDPNNIGQVFIYVASHHPKRPAIACLTF